MANELAPPQQEYETLLGEIRNQHSMFVAKANKYVPKMADALDKAGMTFEQIREKLYSDLIPFWAHGTITNVLPSKYKDQVKAENAKRRHPLLTENEQTPPRECDQTPPKPQHEMSNYHAVNIEFVNKSGPVKMELTKPHLIVTHNPDHREIKIRYSEQEQSVHLPKSDYLAYNAPMAQEAIAKICDKS